MWVVRRMRGARGGPLFGGRHVGVWWFACAPSGVGLLSYTLLFLRPFTRRAGMGIPLGCLVPAGALACFSWCGVPFVFFRVALFA